MSVNSSTPLHNKAGDHALARVSTLVYAHVIPNGTYHVDRPLATGDRMSQALASNFTRLGQEPHNATGDMVLCVGYSYTSLSPLVTLCGLRVYGFPCYSFPEPLPARH